MSTFLILGIDRKNTLEEAIETVELAIKYKHQGVVGVDLCGNPTKGDVTIFREAFAKARENGLSITLHFAEVPFSSTDEELNCLLSYQPARLGHVINVPEHIKAEIERRKLGLELCLTCNVDAKLIQGSFAAHHFGYWRSRNCPLAICVGQASRQRKAILLTIRQTDDVGIFASPVSNEYALLAQHFSLSKAAVLKIARGATDIIFGPLSEKIRLNALLDKFEENL